MLFTKSLALKRNRVEEHSEVIIPFIRTAIDSTYSVILVRIVVKQRLKTRVLVGVG